MPPQPGVFYQPPGSLGPPHRSSRPPAGYMTDLNSSSIPPPPPPSGIHRSEHAHLHHPVPNGPPGGHIGSGSSSRRKKDLATKLSREINHRRLAPRSPSPASTLPTLLGNSHLLAHRPAVHPGFQLALYPLTLERTAKTVDISRSESVGRTRADNALEEERKRVNAVWTQKQQTIKDEMFASLEERRKRAREEKEGEGAMETSPLMNTSRTRRLSTQKIKLTGDNVTEGSIPEFMIIQSTPDSAPTPVVPTLASVPLPLMGTKASAVILPLGRHPKRVGGIHQSAALAALANASTAATVASASTTNGGGGGRAGGKQDHKIDIFSLPTAKDVEIAEDLGVVRTAQRGRRRRHK